MWIKLKAKFVGSVRDKNGYAVHLFYRYKNHEYMITAENNGYSETLREKHKQEQKHIDEAIAEQEKSKTGKAFNLSVLDLLYQED